jgi:hypothetical protein
VDRIDSASSQLKCPNRDGKRYGRDLFPCFRTNLSLSCAKERGRKYVEKQLHGNADDCGTPTGRAGRRCTTSRGKWGVEAHRLGLEGEVYGGMDVSQAQEVKQLRDENARLKKLVEDLSLDKDALQVCEKYAFSERRACRVMRSEDGAGDVSLPVAAHDGRLHLLRGRSGERVNLKRLHQIYRETGHDDSAKEKEALRARRQAASGAGFCARRDFLEARFPLRRHGRRQVPWHAAFPCGSPPCMT